jgi:acetylornithine/N-succinyldiaminopimelate aminotransferase
MLISNGLASYTVGMLRNRIIYNSYSPWVFDLEKAEGSFLWTTDGDKLIDFSSGWNVVNLGWNHPEINEAVINQAGVNVYAPMWTADKVQNEYAEKLTAALPDNLTAVARATGGTEANEMALKMARAMSGRSRIVSIRDSYHGQSFGSIAAGFRPEFVKAISPVVPHFTQLEYPSTDRTEESGDEALKKFAAELEDQLSKNDVAAVLTEAGIVTGWGTTSVASKGYLKLIRELTTKFGTLLILDEVGTGFSRCGKLFALEIEDVVPDFVTLAKGISNGAAPIGATVTTDEIANTTYAKATLTSTFGWTPLACAAALKTLEIHQRDRVWQNAAGNGRFLLETLTNKLEGNPRVKEVRGIGMEVGIQLNAGTSEKDVVKEARSRGLHLAEAGEGTLQLMPPLTIDRPTLNEAIRILVDCLAN